MTHAGIEITAELGRDLVRGQHSDLADRPVRLGALGWDNQLWRLGDGGHRPPIMTNRPAPDVCSLANSTTLTEMTATARGSLVSGYELFDRCGPSTVADAPEVEVRRP